MVDSSVQRSQSSIVLGQFSVSDDGPTTNCKRCRSSMPQSYLFCAHCGYPTKSNNTVYSTAQPIRENVSSRSNISPTLNVSLCEKRKKTGRRNNHVQSNDVSLHLPQPVIDSIEKILSVPTLDSKSMSKRSIQVFRTQLLEIRNAEDIEVAVANKQEASLGLENNIFSQQHSIRQNSNENQAITGQREKRSLKPVQQRGYLSEVESISNHYSRYLARLKQLEGIRAAMMEAPPLPSAQREVVRKTRKSSGSREEAYIPLEGFQSPDNHISEHFNQKIEKEQSITTDVAGELNNLSTEQQHTSQSNNSGMAFMWGPVFNASGSVADASLHSSATAPPGVQYIDFEGEVGMKMNEETIAARERENTPESNRSSRSASPHAAPSPHQPIPQPLKVPERRPQSAAAPVVMFWGNIMQNDALEVDDGGTPGSAHFSRASSFRSTRTDSSGVGEGVSYLDESAHLAVEEAELPAWIEALAAETAGIRAEFQQEDEMIMEALCERLQQMDAAILTVQSRRALLVQYSMDGVVNRYREKIKQMKVTMGLKSISSRPGTASSEQLLLEGGSGHDGGGGGGGVDLFAVLEEKRAIEEVEDSLPFETPQGESLKISSDEQLQQRRLSNKGVFQTTGEVLLKAEQQEEIELNERDQRQAEDEKMMQELIINLTQAHLQAIGSESVETGVAAKNALQREVAATSTAERRIGALLQKTERLEEQNRLDRERQECTDDLALKQWLVAVTAFDADRARKQTLRTLQLEELEDRMGDDSDEDEEGAGEREGESVDAATRSIDGSAELAAASISVPDNSSLATIKTLYRQSCSKMLASLPELNVDFTVDQAHQPDFRMDARTKLQFARRILKASSNVDHKVAMEYRKFLDFCAVRRAAVAMELSQAMQKASELERSYRERYAQATREFKSSADAMLADSSDRVKQITSSKHMQAIKRSAELDISQQGQIVKTIQANEAKLLLDTR